jgi:hypothetical protein
MCSKHELRVRYYKGSVVPDHRVALS